MTRANNYLQKPAVSDSPEPMLIKIFKSMPSGEIAERLAAPGMSELARGVAQNELHKRSARTAEVPASVTAPVESAPAAASRPTPPPLFETYPDTPAETPPASPRARAPAANGQVKYNLGTVIFLALLISVVLGAILYVLIVHTPDGTGMFAMAIAAIALPVLGKTFPKLGLMLGVLTMTAAGLLVVGPPLLYAFTKELSGLGLTLLWPFSLFFAMIVGSLGKMLLYGARHRGTMDDMFQEMEAHRQRVLDQQK